MMSRFVTASRARGFLALAGALAFPAGCAEDNLPSAPSASPVMSATIQPSSAGELRAYVTNSFSSDVSVIRVADNSVIATIPVDERPQHVAITPDGRFAYVTHFVPLAAFRGIITVIRTVDNSIVATLPKLAGQFFNTTTITPDGVFAYVMNGIYVQDNPATHVQVLRTADNAVTATLDAGPHVMGAVTSDGGFIYMTGDCRLPEEGCVRVVRTSDNIIVATIPVGDLPNRIVLTPDDSRAYVSHTSSDVITVIRTSDNTVETTFEIPAALGLGMGVDSRYLYVASRFLVGSGTVTVVRTSDHGVETVFSVGHRPAHVELTPDGSLAYVPNDGSGTVSVVRTTDHATIATIPVGDHPAFVAFALVRSVEEEAAGLQDAIDELEAAGRLSSGRANSLRNHIENALRALGRGQTAPAIAQLEAFIAQVQQLVADGVLTGTEAAPIIAAAENAIAAAQAGG